MSALETMIKVGDEENCCSFLISSSSSSLPQASPPELKAGLECTRTCIKRVISFRILSEFLVVRPSHLGDNKLGITTPSGYNIMLGSSVLKVTL